MVSAFHNYLTWYVYSLSVGFLFIIALAKTNTYPKLLSKDLLQDFDKNSGATLYINSTINREAKNFKCMPMIKYFQVELIEHLKPGEGVGLTGDHVKLGEWQIDKSPELRRRRRNPLKWYLKIHICSSLRIYYRFFIYYKDSRGFKHLRYWEGQQHPRVLEAYEMFRHQGSQKFGQAHALAVGGGIENERGWLRQEYIIQLKFIWHQHIIFTKFSHLIRKPRYLLKLKAYQDDERQPVCFNSTLELDTELQVTRFMANKTKLRALTEQGEFYKPGVVVVFHITVADFQKNFYVLGIYTRQEELLGEVVISSTALQHSEGILELPIFDSREQIRVGWLTLPFLRIEALPQAVKFNMRAGFHHYWPYNWPTMDIGSRGVGKSFYYHSANAMENTLQSFLKAQDHYSDMIQLDVQLTKDYVPVVWHDYGFFSTTPKGKKRLIVKDFEYVYIHNLTYKELLNKRVFKFIKGLMVELTFLNSPFVQETERIFPLLSQIYKKLSTTLGIMVVIKWPQLFSSGNFELLQPLDKNLYVNALIQTSIEYGCGRPLIMASFDADICTMLRFKQHIYPVVFLTMGKHSPWESYADLRTHSLTNALRFVQASDILGSAIYAKEIFPATDNKDLQMAFEMQQLVFVWGDHLINSSILEHFKNHELAGLIYDRIDHFMNEKPKRKQKRFGFFEAAELQQIFLRQCIAAGNMSISEGLPDPHSPFWPRLRSLNKG